MTWTCQLVPLPDGRQVEVLDCGVGDRALVFSWGTPGAAIPDPSFPELAERHGLRVLQPNRPGYGLSDPHPGRAVVDVVADVGVVLDALAVSDVVCVGGSGGGPHTLAMAARLPQCRAAAALVSPAPRDADGLDYYAGMAESNQEEWLLADAGEAAVRPWLEKTAASLLGVDGRGFVEQFADAISAADRAAYTSASGGLQAARFAKAVERGIEGWLEDDIALTTSWGFALSEIDVPLSFWVGRRDQFISYRHTLWLAERVPHADLHVYGDEGHVSLRLRHMDAIMLDLLAKAGW